MSTLAKAMEVLFIASWLVGAAAWMYGTRFFLPMWAVGFRKSEVPVGYGRKMAKGYAVFLAAGAVGFAAGFIADYWGGGWK